MVFYRVTFTFGQKPWKAKKWHNKFPHFSISEAAVTSTIIIMTRSKGDIWSHEYEKAAKILKTISTQHTQSRWCRSNLLGIQLFFLSGHTTSIFISTTLRAVEIGLGIPHFCYQIKKNRTKRTLTTKAFVNEIWNGKVAWLSLMKPAVKPPPPSQFVNDSLWLWKYFWT